MPSAGAEAGAGPAGPRLLAVSDLHVGFPENRKIVADMYPESASDWLLVAGDVGELMADIEWALGTLSQRFATVVWVPGNHDLWTHQREPVPLRGQERYLRLVESCRRLGVITPEDPCPVWDGAGGPVRDRAAVPALRLLLPARRRHDQGRGPGPGLPGGRGVHRREIPAPRPVSEPGGVVPGPGGATERRLAELDPGMPNVLVNHFPLVREPTRVLRYPVFAQWCGTIRTAHWHVRFNAAAVVYGHLHIPRTTWYDGVRFEEVSLGYPREWRRRDRPPSLPRQVLPVPPAPPSGAAPR